MSSRHRIFKIGQKLLTLKRVFFRIFWLESGRYLVQYSPFRTGFTRDLQSINLLLLAANSDCIKRLSPIFGKR